LRENILNTILFEFENYFQKFKPGWKILINLRSKIFTRPGKIFDWLKEAAGNSPVPLISTVSHRRKPPPKTPS
jgi:hypothetical protein